MDNVTEQQWEGIDRPTCIEKWAELLNQGVDQPLPTMPQSPAYDVHCDSEKNTPGILAVTWANIHWFE